MKLRIKFPSKKPAKKLAVRVSISKSLILAAAMTIPLQTYAGIESDMANMFNSMGVEANYTKGGAFHGQSGSHYTTGNLNVRAPVSNIQLANIQLPSISAGCGGIDIFGGAFSFVNKEQFVQFTRNLGNNAAGVAFDLALKALDPMIQDAIGGIRNIVNMINRANLNSCQMAQSIVGGVMGSMAESARSNCKASAVESGAVDDGAGSGFFCQFAENLVNESNKIRGTGTPQDTIGFTGGNLTYESLKKVMGGTSDADMSLYYSLLGTAVFIPITDKGDDEIQFGVQAFAPTITSAKTLLKGTGDKQGDKIKVDMLTCVDGDKRMKERCSKQEVQIPSLRHKFKTHLTNMVNKIRTDSGWNQAEVQEIATLINNSRFPILKIAVNDAVLGGNDLQKDSVIDLISIDFIANILDKHERSLRQTLGLYNKLDSQATVERDRLFDNLKQLRQTLATERAEAMKQVSSEMNMIQAMARFDDQWRAAFTDLSGSMQFDTMNRL